MSPLGSTGLTMNKEGKNWGAQRERFEFTSEILDRAEEIRNTASPKLPWKTVAERLGCDANTLQVVLCQRRKGKNKGRVDARKRECVEIEKMILEEDLAGAAIARRMGVTRSAVCRRLKRMGFDKEVRAELKRIIKVP